LTIEEAGTRGTAPATTLVDPVVEEDKRMESDSGLDFVVDDVPGIGRR
jgi:hypothetical protein